MISSVIMLNFIAHSALDNPGSLLLELAVHHLESIRGDAESPPLLPSAIYS